MLLLWLLVSSGASGATIKCKNETVTLGKKGLNQWNLTGTLAANQNCVYKITVPTFSSALVTANIKLFSEGHRLIISDQYGAVIQNEGESFVFEVELPDPAVTIRLAIGAYEGEATAPVIEALSVRNVPYEVFEPPYEQSSADLVSEVSLPEKANGSSILFSSTSNVRLIVFSLEEPNLDLLNVHVYSYTDDWTLLGTLYAPAAWESHNSKHLGIFITRKIDSAVSIIATSDTNIAKYGGWNSSFAIVDRGDMSKGPSFCLDSEAGIEAFSIYTMTQEYQNRGLELSDLIVTAIEGNYTSLTVVEKFPSRLGNPAIYWAVG